MSSARRGGMQSRHSRVASMSGPYESNHNGRVSSGWQRDSPIINRGAPNQPYNAQFLDNNTRLYVGNLAWGVTWQELKDHMKRSGGHVVRADVMTDLDGRSKGCGIVEYASPMEAKDAIVRLNNTELLGRPIHIREDRENSNAFSFGGPMIQPGMGGPPPMMRQVMFDPPHQHMMMQAPALHHAPPHQQLQPMHQPPPQVINQNGMYAAKLGVSRFVYVGNLSWDVMWQDLKDHMKEAGNVIRADVMMGDDGRSKGCGIVEYATVEEANRAILQRHNSNLKGRLIFVREDRDKDVENPNRKLQYKLFVGNLEFGVTWQELKDHFKSVVPVIRANILLDSQGKSRGCGIIELNSPEDAAMAIAQLNNSVLNDRQILVREDRDMLN